MTRAHRSWRAASIVAPAALAPGMAWPHAFGERYDLPVPLGYFIVGAAAVVALSFVVAAMFMRGKPRESSRPALLMQLGPLLPLLHTICRVLGVILLCAIVLAGFLGTLNPEMNLAPILVWIIWWVGFSFVVACFGNLWPALDPWRTIFEWVDGGARRLGARDGISLRLPYPAALGSWPAVLLLLGFVWIEVLYPHAVVPPQLATIVLAWSAFTLLGMLLFGGEAWRRGGDVFHIYFDTLGRFAPIAVTRDGRCLEVRPFGSGLIAAPTPSLAMVGFVIAMLATVLFDGLLGTQVIRIAHRALAEMLPALADKQGYFVGTTGLICVWLAFFGAFLLSCLATTRLTSGWTVAAVARLFSFTLVPIAIAYNIAHYFSYLLVHGQLIVPVLSDPLGRGWDLFGTMQFYPDIGIISARVSWHLAIVSIVAGHIISIWLAHRLALHEFDTPREAVVASIPLTVLMVLYTAISLLVMAEPLVQFAPLPGGR